MFTLSLSIVRFLASASVLRLRGDCTDIVQSLCSCSTASAQNYLYGFRAEAALRGYGDHAVAVPYLSMRSTCGARAGIVQCHLQHVYGLRTYDFVKIA